MDKLLSLKETEQLLNVSKSTLQRWDNSGKLIALRTEGGHRRYKQSDIERLIGENKNEDAKQEQRKIERKEREIKVNNDLLKLIQDTKDSMINGFSKMNDDTIYGYVLCGVEMSFDKIIKIIRFYDDVINGKWIKFSDAYPEDFNLDWVLVQFVEKSGFVGLPYIAEFDKSKNIWRLQGQESDNTSETYYINNDCIPSSWKIIENSPEKNSK